MMRSDDRQRRTWAIRGWCVLSSLVLATIAEVALLAAFVVAIGSGNRHVGMLALPLVWPVFYAGVFGVSYGIALVNPRGPVLKAFPRWYRDLLPRPVRRLGSTTYRILPNMALVAFPLMMSLASGVVLWAAMTGRLNP